jgi:hypothetical protein
VIHRHLGVFGELLLIGDQFEYLNRIERPPMRRGPRGQLFLCLGERDIEAFFPAGHPFQQKLQRQGGLAGAGIAINEIEPMGD